MNWTVPSFLALVVWKIIVDLLIYRHRNIPHTKRSEEVIFSIEMFIIVNNRERTFMLPTH